MIDGRIPPQDVEAENAVLGAILLDQQTRIQAFSLLTARDFYSTANGKIYAAMLSLDAAKIQIDAITLREELRRLEALEDIGGRAKLNDLVSSVASSANVEAHAQIVKEKSMLRQIAADSIKAADMAFSGTVSPFELLGNMTASANQLVKSSYGQRAITVRERMPEVIKAFEQGINYKIGLPDFDNLVRVEPTTRITVGATPGSGKSVLAKHVAEHVSKSAEVIFYSLEMGDKGLFARLLSTETGYSTAEIKWEFSRLDKGKIDRAIEKLSRAPIAYNFSPGITSTDIRLQVAAYKTTHPDLALVVVDYLQMVAPPSGKYDTRDLQITAVSRDLLRTARESDVCVLAVSQLRRAESRRPQLSDLRESGSLEADTDVAILLHRPELHGDDTLADGSAARGKIEAAIAKNRNGGITGSEPIILGFDGSKMRVYSLANERVMAQLGFTPNKLESERPPF